MKLAFGCDHAAYSLKLCLIEYAKSLGHEVIDFGCNSEKSVDYPDFAYPVAQAVAKGDVQAGVVLCYTGIGVSITANKVRGIRCSLCSEPYSASLTRRHNDSNVLALGAGMIGAALAKEILRVWLTTEFEGGRHQNRINKISAYEAL